MVGPVIQHGLEVHQGIARQGAVDTGLPEALFHRREEVPGHGAAEDLLGEDHLLLVGVVLEPDPHVAELAAAASLLLVPPLLLDGLPDFLPVGHPGGLQLRFHLEAVLQLADQHVHLHIARAGDHHLVGLGVVYHGEGGVLFIEAVQALGDLILLAPGLGLDGHGVAGLREGDILQADHLPLVAEGVPGLDVHFGNGADVAADQFLDLGVLLSPDGVQAAQLHLFPGAGVHHGHIRRNGAGEDLDEGVLAVLVGDGLEDEGGGHAAGGDDEFFRLAVGLGGLVVVALHGIGQQVHDVVHQHQGAQAVDGGAAEDGEEAQLPDALAQALDHLGVGEVLAAEEFFHQLLAGLGHGFLEGVVELGDDAFFVGGDLDFHPLEVLHLIGPLVQNVDDSGDLFAAVPDGDHHGGDLLAEALAQGLEGGVVVGVVLVGFRDIDEAGHVPLLAVFPRLLQAHGHAVLGGADDNRGVGGPEGGHGLPGEVERAGGVHQVDAAALIVQGSQGEGEGNLALGLLGIVVADGVAVGGPAHSIDDARHVKQAFGQGGLAAAAVPQQTDVADVLYRIAHDSFHSLVSVFQCGLQVLHQLFRLGRFFLLVGLLQHVFQRREDKAHIAVELLDGHSHRRCLLLFPFWRTWGPQASNI